MRYANFRTRMSAGRLVFLIQSHVKMSQVQAAAKKFTSYYRVAGAWRLKHFRGFTTGRGVLMVMRSLLRSARLVNGSATGWVCSWDCVSSLLTDLQVWATWNTFPLLALPSGKS